MSNHVPRDIRKAKKSGGWLWMEKAAIDRILNCNHDGVSTAITIAVYAALCRLSSNDGDAPVVTAGAAQLGFLAGCRESSVKRAVKCLESIGLVEVGRSKNGTLNNPNLYCLLTTSNVGPMDESLMDTWVPQEPSSGSSQTQRWVPTDTLIKKPLRGLKKDPRETISSQGPAADAGPRDEIGGNKGGASAPSARRSRLPKMNAQTTS